ncbi:MAG: hypothetical protein K2X81_04630, partial [Candidatus Obscuribacterales bacterium]|nr:hypothetical protein [Candidatus Obscuribacterales bacterium]
RCFVFAFGTVALISGMLRPALAADGSLALVGSIDNRYGVQMNLNLKGSQVNGSYKYLGKTSSLKLAGSIDPSGKILLKEFDPKGKNTGIFTGVLVKSERLSGIWKDTASTSDDVGRLPFLLTSEADQKSIGDGTDGIILQQTVVQIHKRKDSVSSTPVAVVKYPQVVEKFFPAPSAVATMQASLAPGESLGHPLSKMKSDIAGGDSWLDGVDYQIHYNKKHLLSLEMIENGCGAYPSGFSKYTVINTSTGKILSAKDVFLESSLKTLKEMIHKKLQANGNEQLKESGVDDPGYRNQLKQDIAESLKTNPIELSAYEISEQGITFKFDWGFPHVILAFEPSGDCFFSFSELKPYIRRDGPLSCFL